jgi:hypothetical protein
MLIQINSDHTVDTTEAFAAYAREVLKQVLHNHSNQITRLEVHFTDENGRKEGLHDMRCAIEARLAGRKPIGVHDQADTREEALSGAAEKLKHALVTILSKEHDHHPRIDGGLVDVEPLEI